MIQYTTSSTGGTIQTAAGSDRHPQEIKQYNHTPGPKKETTRSKQKQKTAMARKVAGENYR